MAEQLNLEYIVFKAYIFDRFGFEINDLLVDIQFFDVSSKKWTVLISEQIYSSLLDHEIKIYYSENKVANYIGKSIRKYGTVPNFRIVLKDSSPIEIIASNFTINFDKKTPVDERLIIDFGRLRLLDGLYEVHSKNFVTKALPDELLIQIKTDLEKDSVNEDLLKINKELKIQVDLKEKEIKELKNNFSEVDKNNQSNEKIVSLKEELNTLQQEITNNEKIIGKLKKEQGLKNNEIKSKDRIIKDLQLNITAIQKQLNNQVKLEDFALLKEKKIENQALLKDNLKKQILIDSKQERIKELEEENKDLKEDLNSVDQYNQMDDPNKIEARKVYSNIVSDIARAQKELADSDFLIDSISMNLKATVENGPKGTVLNLINSENSKQVNGNAISNLKIDVIKNKKVSKKNYGIMPDVIGLTETAVRKILYEYALVLDPIYHMGDNPNLVVGQSFKQSPLAGDAVLQGQKVTVIFLKSIS